MLVESLLASTSLAAAASGAAPLSAAGTETAAARFAELMQPAGDDLVPSVGAAAVPGASGATLGDAILNRMAAVGESYHANREALHGVLKVEPSGINLHDLLRLQLQTGEVSLYVDLIAKATGKLTQGVNDLMKLQ